MNSLASLQELWFSNTQMTGVFNYLNALTSLRTLWLSNEASWPWWPPQSAASAAQVSTEESDAFGDGAQLAELLLHAAAEKQETSSRHQYLPMALGSRIYRALLNLLPNLPRRSRRL